MKRVVLLSVVLAGCGSGEAKPPLVPLVPVTYRDVVLADQPIAYYDFNLDARDTVGRHTGTAKNGVTFGKPGATPALGTAAEFDGSTGRIQIPSHADFRSIAAGPFTIELWFLTTSATRGDLFNWKIEEGPRDFGIFSCLGGEGELTEYEAGDFRARTDGVPINAWHHVVVTRDVQMTVTLYVDGEKRDAGTGELSLDYDADLLIGCNHIEGDYDQITLPFSGLIDEVAIYKTALSADRVKSHFKGAGATASKPAPEAVKPPPVKDPVKPLPTDDQGFATLFNGSNFDSFKFYLGAKDADPSKTFSIVDGAIICTGNPAGYVYTRRRFSQFTLRYDWRFKRPANLKDDSKFGGNSGCLLFITAQNALGVWPKSIEVQGMNRDAGMILAIPRGVKCKIQDFPDARKKAINPVGEWNSNEIISKDGAVTTIINGHKVSVFTDCELTEGPIGWQSEGAEIHWRNIRIKEEK